MVPPPEKQPLRTPPPPPQDHAEPPQEPPQWPRPPLQEPPPRFPSSRKPPPRPVPSFFFKNSSSPADSDLEKYEEFARKTVEGAISVLEKLKRQREASEAREDRATKRNKMTCATAILQVRGASEGVCLPSPSSIRRS